MLDKLLTNLDFLPGKKSYFLAGAASLLFFANVIGIVDKELYDMLLPYILAAMAPTVALKLMRG